MRLERTVYDPAHHARHEELDQRHLDASLLGTHLVDPPTGVVHEQSSGVDLRAALGDPVLDGLLGAKELTRCRLARRGATAHQIEAPLRDSDPAHAVMDASRSQASLSDGEPLPLAAQEVLLRNTAVLEPELRVAPPAFSLIPHARDVAHATVTGRIGRHDDLAGALVQRRVRIRHDHRDGERRPVRRRCEPLVTVDHVVPTVLDRGRRHPDRIRSGVFWLGHREAAADLARGQRTEPALLLGLGSELVEDLHVPRIGRLRVEHVHAVWTLGQLLADERVLHEPEPQTTVLGRNLRSPQARLANSLAYLLESRSQLAESLAAGFLLERVHLLVHESPDLLEERLGGRRNRKVQGQNLPFSLCTSANVFRLASILILSPPVDIAVPRQIHLS